MADEKSTTRFVVEGSKGIPRRNTGRDDRTEYNEDQSRFVCSRDEFLSMNLLAGLAIKPHRRKEQHSSPPTSLTLRRDSSFKKLTWPFFRSRSKPPTRPGYEGYVLLLVQYTMLLFSVATTSHFSENHNPVESGNSSFLLLHNQRIAQLWNIGHQTRPKACTSSIQLRLRSVKTRATTSNMMLSTASAMHVQE